MQTTTNRRVLCLITKGMDNNVRTVSTPANAGSSKTN